MTAVTTSLSDANGYGLFSARPAAGLRGRVYWASDTGAAYRDNGTTWDTLIAGAGALTVEELDGSPTGTASKLVLPNGTVAFVGTTATYTPQTPALVKLSSTVLGADAANITVTGISQAYKDLIMVFKSRSANASFDNLRMRCGNGSIDTAAHYSYLTSYRISQNGAYNADDDKIILNVEPGANMNANVFAQGELTMFDYVSTAAAKMMIGHSFYYSRAVEAFADEIFGLWNQALAIDQIMLYTSTGANLKAGSSLTLYGRT